MTGARVKNSTAKFAHSTTYLLAEGGTAIIRFNAGYSDIYNADEVSRTRLTVWCPTGNVYVTENGGGIQPITPEIPPALRGPYQEGAERRTVVEYVGQPGAYPVETDVHLQGRPWAYSDEVVYFKLELLRDDGTVYADNGFEIEGQRIYPHVQLRLCTSAGREEQPDGVENFHARAIDAKNVVLWWDTPVEATSTAIYYKTEDDEDDDPPTLLTDSAPVGKRAWYVHESLTAGKRYSYYLKCANTEGDSGDAVLVGTVKTPVLPAVPDPPVITSVVTPNAVSAMLTFEPSGEAVLPDGTTVPNEYRVYGRLASADDLPENYVTIKVPGDTDRTSVDWLFPATEYVVYMTAVNVAGESTATAHETFTTPAAPGNPPTPTNLEVTTLSPNSQTVSWDVGNEDIVGFGLYYSTDQNTWTAVQDFAPLPATARSWTQTGLTQNTTYYWRVFAFNYVDGVLTKGTPAQAIEATNPAPEQPDATTAVSCVSYTNTSIAVSWTPGANAGDGTVKAYKVYRSTDDSTYVLKGTVPPNVLYFVDRGLTPNTVYYYRVDAVGYGGDVTGAKSHCATLHSSGTMFPVCGFDLHPDSRNRIIEVAGRALITSDRDRWVVRYGDSWFKAGLRPIRGSVGLAKATGGVLDLGTYVVFLVLVRGETRSIPSAMSTTVTTDGTDKTLVVTPPTNTAGDKVECRDIGYDVNGNVIDGAEFWEIYVGESTQDTAYRVAQLPLAVADWEDSTGSGTYTIDNTLTTAAIFDGTRRPLETQLESSLPPAAWEVVSKDNRIFATGEVTLKPTAAEVTAGAKLTITNGNKYFEVSGWDASDGCLYHRLELDGIDTGWEVYDYDHDVSEPLKVTKCYIRHSDPAVEAGGFGGATGDYTDFALLGTPSRVYLSAYFSGNALAGIVYSPETFPPLTIAETEFFPDDNGEVLSLVASGELVLAGKPEKWIAVSGGDEIDVPVLSTRAISRNVGINAIYSAAQDANGYTYFLGDTGVFRVSAGGVEKVNVRIGCRRMFSDVFDMSSVPNGKGAWFSREDWYVVVGLNRKGSVGNRDGFILDTRNGALFPFTTPKEMTHVREYKSAAGDFQMLFGGDGCMGYLFKRGLYVDNVDYTGTYALAGAFPIKGHVTTGVVDAEQALKPRWVQPRVKANPRDARFDFRLELDDKTRCDDAGGFVAVNYVDFNTDFKGDHVSMAGVRCQQMQYRLLFETRVDMPDARFEFRELPMRLEVCGAS